MVETHAADCGAIVVSDYGKGVLTPAVVAAVVAAADEHGVPVIVDPKGRNYAVYRGATVVTPNRKELQEATGLKTATDAEVVTAAAQVVRTCGVANVLATRSQDGMTLFGSDGAVHHLAAETREVFDVSGAGDTVVATLAAAMAAGISLVDGAVMSNAAAGVVVGKAGTAPIHASELIEALQRQEGDGAEDKVLPLERLQERVAEWRARGLKVGFTNGCFDLLHPGHLSLLRQSKAACDRLIVGLNSDESVQRLKGPSRPAQNEVARALVLASLGMVDGVCIFGEDTPLKLITALLPDILVKGADYTVDQVVGAKEVQAAGGRVLLAELQDGFSTTATIDRMGRG
jgi:D-beta-D-heptose 7-phosphate kinase/D-beta-D-heptose 1-phosphate adenosyltransferase